MWRRQTEPDSRTPDEVQEGRNRRVAVAFLLLCGFVLLLVSGLPAVLVPPALSQLLGFAGLVAAVIAALSREHMFAGHLTHWDQAAAFMGLSVLAAAFTDPTAVGEFMESLAAASPPGAPPG